MRRLLIGCGALFLATVLTACAQGKTPLDDAYALHGEYQAIAHAELALLATPVGEDVCVKDKVKAADRVAYGYVENVSDQSLKWDAAAAEDKPKELSLFDRLLLLGQNALAEVQQAMKPCKT